MSTKLILSFSLCLMVLSCSAQAAQLWPWRKGQDSRPHHGHQQFQQQCDIQRLTASEPSRRVRSEAGVTEIWDHNTPEFRCTGFVAVRYVIQPGGLLLPSYSNAPYITFVEQGRGVQGVVIPGCPETFQSDSEYPQSQRGQHSRESESQESSRGDQHQKIFRVREGDVIPSPAGVVQWTHNDGDQDLISVTLLDANSFHNQLDENVRSFFLAGQSQQGREERRSQQQTREEGGDRQSRESDDVEALIGANILSGFQDEILHELFRDVDRETISKLRGENDQRGFIVQAQDLKLRVPEDSEEGYERQRGDRKRDERGSGRSNGLEQAFCNLKFRQNVNRPSHADVFNPRAGRINTVNSNNLPILEFLQLSAQHVVLYKNAIIGPRWNLNAHSALYVTRGEGRVQVVGDEGKSVFDDNVQRGQILVVPQGFAVVVKAGRQGLEWVELKNNDNAITSPIAGRTSVLRAIPVEVLANSYDISTEEAYKLKNGRQEVEVFRPFQSRYEKEEEKERERFSIV
uniref:13S globulin seed storage protein n=1 Tax=Fagopyrum tataricum TaxID=62330 RepID=13S_FAGTA|nr:RecName: Full=13S globulin seed storage protein; AltName: Full=13S globulin; AltName: Full=Legumin-like protein; AltName: Full=Major allergen Fag t 1; AltName: Full=TBt; AltName: Allergen=Fag t 1; Contains: RecName: Full=13S globulin seed storage protein acidic chain; AltName: Full=13S globulin TBb chain; AltName: Full=34 kDa allergenic protein; AltName: Full=Allergen b; AltName: Full=N-terminal subunit TBb; AltName: Full=TBb; Contains: RecName: Full=13S globulin seed storage protein basic chain